MASSSKKKILEAVLEMFTTLFTGMMDKGLLKRDDPAMLAFAYTAPMKAKLTVYYTVKGCEGRILDEYQNAET